MNKYLLIGISLFFLACESPKERGLISQNAMVVSARAEASEIGTQIMKQGGNAFDAMIATDLALAVTYPRAGNLGGGGFMVYRKADGTTGAIDYREKAPMKATKDMYLDGDGNIIKGLSTFGAMANGVPGTVAGLFAIHEEFGSLPFKDLIQPAIQLAENGFILTKKQANTFNRYIEDFEKANNRKTLFSEKKWTEGDRLKLPKLAETLKRIQKNGRDEFYQGKTAELLVAYNNDLGGILSLEDLKNYKATWRSPVEFEYRDHKIISMTMPSSGGVCLAQILGAVEPFNLSEMGHNSAEYIQVLTEAERRAYADRSYYLGDMDYVEVPIQKLIDKEYIAGRMSNFDWNHATKSSDISHGTLEQTESTETTHYSIVDPNGNAVAVTTTLNGNFGSKVYVEEAGFFVNNEMDDFSSKPGTPNMFGLIGAEANAIAPGKRMLSSMTPTIVESNGKLKMVVGSPGGSRIITSVLQNILNVIEFDMSMQESVSSSRFHHQWLPDLIFMEEKGFNSAEINKLESKGYQISKSKAVILGKVDAVLVLPDGSLEGGADPRGDDTAVGF
ncbi:gamma-glutamyltransferase [Flavobacteriaceae bacterium]|nr:gamma-glutamyltransferase [Flavobacteriaceae bacterium]